jgi:hypothetical protein
MRASSNSAYRCLFLTLLGCAFLTHSLNAQPAKKDKDAKTGLQLPSGAIIVVTSNPDPGARPDAYYLTPEKYQELQEQIEQLKKQLAAEKGAPPSSCEIEARVEQRGAQSVARLKTTFKFRTAAPRSLIFLGCQRAHAVDAKLEDGKLPILATTDRGLSMLVESAGEHTLRLDLEGPVTARGNWGEVGFELGLPGAPITVLTVEPPAKVKRLTVTRHEVGGQTLPVIGVQPAFDVRRIDAERLAPGHGGEALGAIALLGVSWENVSEPASPNIAKTAEVNVDVAVGDADIQTEARLFLKGGAKEWRFLAPHNAAVTVGRAPPLGTPAKPIDFPLDQAPEVVRPEPGKTEWKIRFHEANAGDLLAVISARTPRNRDAKTKTIWPTVPIAVFDVAQQSGMIRVKTPPHIRVSPIKDAAAQRVDGSDDPSADSIYRYRSLPVGANGLPSAPLELEIRTTAGVVQTQVHHHLQLGEGGWRLRADIQVTPIRTEVEALDLEVPVPGVFEASTPKLVEGIVPLRDAGPQRRIIQVRLATPQRGDFSLTVEGFYPLALGVQEATIVVPRLLNVFNRSDQVTVAVPEGHELRGSAYQWEGDKPGTRPRPLEASSVPERPAWLSAEVGRALSHVELAWKQLRADVRVDSQIDATLGEHQMRIVQLMHYTFANRPLRKLRLRGPALSGLTAEPGSVEMIAPGEWIVSLPADPGRETTLTVAYNLQLLKTPAETSPFVVPLVWPDGVTACESRLRIWRDPTSAGRRLPILDAGPWQELPPEIVPKQSALPLLVARAAGTNLPLALTFHDEGSGLPSLPVAWIDRTLIQAQAVDGEQRYRARFHVSTWSARALVFELPSTAGRIETRINGIPTVAREGAAAENAGTGVLSISLPLWREREAVLIEIDYHIQVPSVGGTGSWVMRWHPPRPRGNVAVGEIRWQVAIPSDGAPLALGDGVFEERWVIHNGMARPIAAHATRDLEKWIAEGAEPGGFAGGWDLADSSVIAQQRSLAPIRLLVIPRTVLLFAVSLMVLAVGIALTRMPRRAVGLLLTLFAAGAVIVGFVWPQPASQVLAAAQPGLMILVLVLVLQRLLHWRYRRKMARLPAFSRVQAESSVSRNNGQRSSPTSTTDLPVAS